MGRSTILSIAGDGVGREVMPVAVEVLSRFPGAFDVHRAEAGFEAWRRCGVSIAAEVVAEARRSDGVLFGCTATPAPPPEGYVSPILALRAALRLDVNLRPCRSPDGAVDIVLVRNCSEGLYAGIERAIPDGWVAEHVVTGTATRRLAAAAARLARDRRGRVTIVHKANVLRRSDGFFREIAIAALEAAGVDWDEVLSDSAAYHLVRNPERFDVLMMNGQVGDLLSSVAGAVTGGLGLAPSLTLGEGPPLAEPIHGSAPDLAGRGVADPVATVLSAVLLARELGHSEVAARIEGAVHAHLRTRRPEHPHATVEVSDDLLSRLGAG